MAVRHFMGGPRSGEVDVYPSAVPGQRVKIYAEVPDFEGQCSDEQVVVLMGHYERERRSRVSGGWNYWWVPA